MSLIQRQRRCDGRTYRAETVEQRADGGWRNEDAVFQQLERPCVHSSDRRLKLVCYSICHIEPM